MTRREFILLADAVRLSPVPFTITQLGVLADFCKTQNPSFRHDTWLAYATGTGGPVPARRRRTKQARMVSTNGLLPLGLGTPVPAPAPTKPAFTL